MSTGDETMFEKFFFWLATHDAEFMRRYAKSILPETYENVEERWLLSNAIDYWEKYRSPIEQDALTVLLDAKKPDPKFDKETVVELYEGEAPSDSLRQFLLDLSADFLRKRLSLAVMKEYVDSIERGSVEEALEVLNEGVLEMSRSMDGEETMGFFRDFDRAIGEITEMYEDDGRSVPTGIPKIDDIMQGGARPGELCVYLAPPGKGKSQWLVYVSREAVAANKSVMYFSLEMSRPRVNARFAAGLVDIDSNIVHQHKSQIRRKIEKLTQKAGITADFFVKRYPAGGVTVSELIAYVKGLQEEGHRIDMVVVDYGDIVAPVKKSERGRVDDQAAVYQDLRAVAILLDVPVWTASQANRQSLRKKVITIENLADSFDKAKIADFILAQCQTTEEKAKNLVRLLTAKVRNNGDGEFIWCQTDFAKSQFVETEPDREEDDDDE
jgi:hypothetical protein